MSNPHIFLRLAWGARWGFGWSLRALPATTIWLHHPVTRNLPASATFAQECADMRLIEDIGRQRFRSADFVNGKERWALPEGSGISYSYVVYRSGRIYQGHRLDRFSSHTAGYNQNGIGIAVQGNTDLEDMTPEQVEAVARLLVRLKRDGVATQARLTGGHRDTGFATSCPGTHAYRRIAEINALAARIEAGQDIPAVPVPPVPPTQPDPNVRRAQAALNWLLQPTIPLAEDGLLGILTNGADNDWRRKFPSTPSMTPTDVYADYLEATVDAFTRLEKKIDGLPARTRDTIDATRYPGAGNARYDDIQVGTNRAVHAVRGMLAAQQSTDPAAVARIVVDELGPELVEAIKEAGGGASAQEVVDLLFSRVGKA